jgi:hypothetical protein
MATILEDPHHGDGNNGIKEKKVFHEKKDSEITQVPPQ